MTYRHQLPNSFLHICICLVLLIAFNNLNMKAQNSNELSHVNLILEKIMDTDQSLREKFNYALEHYGENAPEFILATQKLNMNDSIHQQKIDSIFHKYGWLTPPQVSEKASKAYFYVIQHAQYEFQKKYESEVIPAFEKGVVDKQEFILFVDRLAIRQQKYQKYGTQIMTDNMGNNYFVPIDTTYNSESHLLEEVELKMRNKDFILFSNPRLVVLFVHLFNSKTNLPISGVDIYLDDRKIGETNLGGFFQTLIKRKRGESILTVIDNNTGRKQSTKLKFQEQVDFFDTYFGWKDSNLLPIKQK